MKLFTINKKKAARGFTLIEILLVVGFIALAGIGIYVVYNKVQTGNAANTEARNLDTLRAGVKNLFGGTVNYANLTETVLLQGRVVPDNMRDAAGANIVNSFGGTVTVRPTTFGGGAANNAFYILYPNVPLDVCSKFVTVGGNGFNKVEIGGVGGTAVKDTSSATGNVLDVAKTATACNSATGSTSIAFTSL
ncbi:hypothetical protein C6P74_24005 [Burkholderia multivorans]|uniref:type 4 pilus major pilin n=1 Tax=Burkholderia multivorans TaxID=87883 RepID=UPI000D010EA9|nr:type 4 pilus major pilin [Burkholderia multivorans]PRD76157.1 hypothetical protein C6P74_24005 [Burkholderia multivorans]